MVAVLVMVGIFSIPAVAKGGNASLWIKVVQGQSKSQMIPWVTYDTGKIFLETRSNFDWPDAFTVFLGKSFQKGNSLTIIPKIGMIWSDKYKAVTPEVLVFGGRGKLAWTAVNQLSFGSGKDRPDFAYHWTEVLWKMNSRLYLGVKEQVYWKYSVAGLNPQLDTGPVLKVLLPYGSYVKCMGTVNPVTSIKKLNIGIGTSF